MTEDKDIVSIIVTKGTLDWAYSTFILASTAAAMDKKVEVFFSFYSIQLLYRDMSKLKVTPLGNPAMIVKSPVGPGWFQEIDWNRWLPQFVWALPGMTWLATKGFKALLKKQNQMDIDELRQVCLDLGVRFTVCTMTSDLLGIKPHELIDGVEYAGAATYYAHSPSSQSIFI